VTADSHLNKFEKLTELFKKYVNIGTLRNVLYLMSAIIVFMTGVLIYGIILNIKQVTLKEAMLDKGFSELQNPNIVIERATFTLKLYEDTVLVKTYRASFGRNVHQIKYRAVDEATP